MCIRDRWKALGYEDELASDCDHNGAFAGREDGFLRARWKIGIWIFLRLEIGFEPGVFSTELFRVELCKCLCGCVVLPDGEIEQSQGSGGSLIGRRSRIFALAGPINATIPGGSQVSGGSVAAKDFRKDVDVYKRQTLSNRGPGASFLRKAILPTACSISRADKSS